MKYLMRSIIYVLFVFLIVSCQGQSKKAEIISIEKFNQNLSSAPNLILLDVRTPEEYSQGHLINAKLINYKSDDFKAQIAKLDKEKPVVVYCRTGNRSSAAAQILVELEFKEVYILQGGFIAWAEGKYPFVKE